LLHSQPWIDEVIVYLSSSVSAFVLPFAVRFAPKQQLVQLVPAFTQFTHFAISIHNSSRRLKYIASTGEKESLRNMSILVVYLLIRFSSIIAEGIYLWLLRGQIYFCLTPETQSQYLGDTYT
jgi:hypothetical protein